jgi:predicted dehydrogenase
MGTERSGKLRVGVCGTAHWAATVHLPALKRNDATELIGVWGRRPERTAELADTFGIRGFDDFDALLGQVDAVAFALSPRAQGALALRAARAGKALILDKPLTTDPAEAAALLGEVERRGLPAACFLTLRHIPALAAFVAAARARGASSATATLHTNPLAPGSPYAASRWRREADGALWDLGPHALTVLTDILGPVEEVAAGRRGHRTVVELCHAAGATSTMSLSVEAPPDDRCERYAAYGAFGSLVADKGDYDRLDAYDGVIREVVAPGSGTSFRDAVAMVGVLHAAAARLSG